MTVSIVWSLSNGGSAVDEPVDLGDIGVGQNSTALQVFVAHTGEEPITNCALYMGEYTDTYGGDAGAIADYSSLIEWGNSPSAGGYGGLAVNFDAEGSFASSWPSFGDSSPSHGLSHMLRSGVGDTFGNAIMFPPEASSEMTVSGVIPAEMTNWPSFQLRLAVPSDESSALRQMELRLRFIYTS